MSGLVTDLRTAARGLWNARGFSAVAIFTLALGTGAAAGMFSVLRTSLLRPPPFKDPDRLVTLVRTPLEPGRLPRLMRWPYPQYAFLRDHAQSFEGVASHTNPHFVVSGYDQPERVVGEIVSAGYFDLLGVTPAAGRTFLADEDAPSGGAPVVILSHALWRRRFGGDPAVLGKQVTVNRASLLVLGIMRPGFSGLSGGAELWIPQTLAPVVSFPGRLEDQGGFIAARLARERTLTHARAELDILAGGLRLPILRPIRATPSRRPLRCP
ncbi:MAG: ABC transporter permease [Gemmatimonadetes bacterium]|nr:ABC transporter permease [Gemmatimonadota bacterium]